MVTSCGDGLLNRRLKRPTMDQADRAPSFVVIQAVQLVAAHNARFAAGAGIKIHLKSILLTLLRLRERDLSLVEALFNATLFVQASKALNCAQIALRSKCFLDDREDSAHVRCLSSS